MIRVIMGDDRTKKYNNIDNNKDKDNEKDKYILRRHSKSDPIEFIGMMRYDFTNKKDNDKNKYKYKDKYI